MQNAAVRLGRDGARVRHGPFADKVGLTSPTDWGGHPAKVTGS